MDNYKRNKSIWPRRSIFFAAFSTKPDSEQLSQLFFKKPFKDLRSLFTTFIKHILSGGGRMRSENEWFNLVEVQEGSIYNTN